MTDNEIVKMLECCKQEIDINGVICGECKKCPNYEGKTGLCKEDLPTVVLDLINRKQAEIESLKADKIIAERHEKDARELYKDVVIQLKTAKSEAIKEFAETAIDRVEKAKAKYQRLCKEQGEEMEEHMHIHFNGIIGIINKLLKELVGDNDAR